MKDQIMVQKTRIWSFKIRMRMDVSQVSQNRKIGPKSDKARLRVNVVYNIEKVYEIKILQPRIEQSTIFLLIKILS